MVSNEVLRREEEFLRVRARLEGVIDRRFHPLLAEGVDMPSLVGAVDQLEAVLGGLVLPLQLAAAEVVGEGGEAVRRNKPPVSLPGRGRGFRLKDGE